MKKCLRVAGIIIAIAILKATFAFNISVFDHNSTARAQASLPPELPRVFLNTAYVPPTNNTINVPSGGDLQAALNQASPGDEIVLQAGATYFAPSDGFSLPPKSGTGWITIRTSNLAAISAEGVRIVPALHAAAMPKIVSRNAGPALYAHGSASGTPHHYRLVGIEFTIASSVTMNYGLLQLGGTGSQQSTLSQVPYDIIVDRCYIHGHSNADLARGVALNSARTAIIDSYISEIHGRGFDTQAIAGWNGPGPYKIVNNFLEAAGENVMFGGADPKITGLVPSDIEFQRNHCFKPLSWNPLNPSYAGKHWSVKNLFELKNASRVLINGNIFENNWADAQSGFGILFTVRNQDGSAPWSVVSDVTFTNNFVLNSAGGVLMLGYDYIWPSQQTRRVSIRNNLFDRIGAPGLGFNGRLFQVSDGLADLSIDHNTAFHTGNVVTASGAATSGFAYTNNVSNHNSYGVIGDGKGSGSSTLNHYFSGYTFMKNVLAGGPGWIYPSGSYFPASLFDVGFVDMAGGDYRLAPSSPYRNAGTDGKDLGANIDEILAAMNSEATPPPPPPPVNQPPSVSVSASATSGAAPLTVRFTANASDADGHVVSYRWDFGDGQTSSVESPSHLYQTPGSFTARLVVTDNQGATANAQVVISVTQGTTPPVVKVLKPNTREVLRINSIYTIKWSVAGASVQSQDVQLSLDGGSTWSNIVRGLPAATTAYAWRVPKTPTGAGRIRVIAYGSNGASGSDMSDTSFVISQALKSMKK